jgi:choline transporter-like protein 2/4/5
MGRKHKTFPSEGLEPSPLQFDDRYDPNPEHGESFYFAQQGPLVKRRSCTDVLCFLLFLAFIGGWVFVAYLGWRDGNISRVVYPTDSQGNICGQGDMRERPFLLLFDLTQCLNPAVLISGCLTPHVCVPKCPDLTFFPHGEKLVKTSETKIKNIMAPYCNVNSVKDLEGKTVSELIDKKICPPWFLESSSLFGRCFPDTSTNHTTHSQDKVIVPASQSPTNQTVNSNMLDKAVLRLTAYLNIREVGERIFSDLAETWWMIGLSMVGACILSFIWIVLMRVLAGLMVWLSICVIFFGSGGLLGYCGYRLHQVWISPDQENLKNILEVNITPYYLEDVLKLRDTWLAFTILLGVIFLVILCIFIFLRQRILIAIALIEQGSKAVGQMFSSLFFPIIPFLLQLIVSGWFLIVAMYLASSGESEYRASIPNGTECETVCSTYKSNDTCKVEDFISCQDGCPGATCNFSRYVKNNDFSWLQVVNVFGLYWGIFFFSAYGEMVLAGVFSQWYWTRKKQDVESYLVPRSMWNALYHVGTIAIGSLLLAVIRIIRTMLEYVERKCKYFNNDFTKCIMCMCKCCLWCLEKFMRFLNRNIYIMCAMKSTNFCKSGKNAFDLIMRNLVRVVVLDSVCDFLLFLGKMVIVLASGVLSYLTFGRYFPELQDKIPNLHYFFTPIVFIVIGSYLIASAFFGVYSMAVDTLFLCFLEDLERNDGSQERPYFMSKSLKSILGKMEKTAAERNIRMVSAKP